MDIQVQINEAPATEYGDQFLEWLRERIETGQVKINSADASVHVTADGVLLERKLFKQFADLSSVPTNMNVVFTQFGNMMGIASKGGGDYLHAQFFSEYPDVGAKHASFTSPFAGKKHSTRTGVLVTDTALVLKKSKPESPMLKSLQHAGKEAHQVPAIMKSKQPGFDKR
jgi:hypothetical protein